MVTQPTNSPRRRINSPGAADTETHGHRKLHYGGRVKGLFPVAPKWKQPKCPSADKRNNRLWYIHTLKYYLPEKKKRKLIQALMWGDMKSYAV